MGWCRKIASAAALVALLSGVVELSAVRAESVSETNTTYSTRILYSSKVVGKKTHNITTTEVVKTTVEVKPTVGKVKKKTTSVTRTSSTKTVGVWTTIVINKVVKTIKAPIKTTVRTVTTTSTSVTKLTIGTNKVALETECAKGWTTPYDLSDTRKAARCTANHPAASPLASQETVLVSAGKTEFWAPITAAINLGEFAKENLNVRLVTLNQSADSMQQLDNGSLDVAVGGTELTLFSAAQKKLNVKMVMGNYTPATPENLQQPQSGIWCRRDYFRNPQKPSMSDFSRGATFAVVGSGKGAVSTYWATQSIRRRYPKFDPAKITYTGMAANLPLTALQNKATDCALLLDPYWTTAASSPEFVLVATQSPGEPFGGYFYGKKLLIDRPEIGVAFARALIRTINTYFNGDYHKNAVTMAEIAKAVPNYNVAINSAYPSLIFDWEIRGGTTTRIQKLFKSLGVIDYDPLPDSAIVDRSFYERAVGVAR